MVDQKGRYYRSLHVNFNANPRLKAESRNSININVNPHHCNHLELIKTVYQVV